LVLSLIISVAYIEKQKTERERDNLDEI
jgi:hypothetical protein